MAHHKVIIITFVYGILLYCAGKQTDQEPSVKAPVSIEAFCLTLPGCELRLPSLLLAKKFRNRGNKEGALTAFWKLQSDGLGKLEGENPVYFNVDIIGVHVLKAL